MTGAAARTGVAGVAGASHRGVAGVARGGLANLVGAGFAAAAGLAVTWLAARGLGPVAAGVFFTGIATFGLLAGVAKLGTPTGLVFWLARLRAQGRPDVARACLRAGLPPVALAATGLAVVVWLAAPWLGRAIGGPAPTETTAVLRTLAPFLPLAALADAALAATRGCRLMRPTIALDKLLRPGLQLLALAGLAVLPVTAVPLWTLGWALPYLPVLVLAGYALVVAASRRLERPGAGPAPRMGTAFWRFTGPRAVAGAMQLALQRLDIVLVAWLAGPVAAALYTVAGRFVLVGQLANQAIGNAVQPRLAERLGVSDVAGTGALYRVATGWLVLGTWPLYLTVALYAPAYLGLFGEAYRSGAPVAAVLAAAMLLATACGPVDMLLAMAGRTSWNLANVALALATMIGVAVVLVPRLGALGAAVGLAAAVAVNNLLPLVQVGHLLRIHPFGTGTLVAAGLAAGCFGVLPVLVRSLVGSGPIGVGAAVVAGVAGYLAGAYRWRRPLALDAVFRKGM